MKLTQVKLARLRAGLVQYDVSRAAQVERSRLSAIENGHVMPRPDERVRLAEALGVSPSRLGRGAPRAKEH